MNNEKKVQKFGKSKELPVMACPKCGQIPEILKDEDPKMIEKRYFTRCSNEECKLDKTVFGATRQICIVNWNNLASKVRIPTIMSERIPNLL